MPARATKAKRAVAPVSIRSSLRWGRGSRFPAQSPAVTSEIPQNSSSALDQDSRSTRTQIDVPAISIDASGYGIKSSSTLDEGSKRLRESTIEEQPFRFLDLPTELRLNIYRLCLTRSEKVPLSRYERTVQSGASVSVHEGDALSLSFNFPSAQSTQGAPGVTSRPTWKAEVSSEASTNGLHVAVLRTCKQIYREARDVLYSENVFNLNIYTAVKSLAALHQRSRRSIQHVELVLPTYTEILENFSEIVRLSLRYCVGLKKLVIHTPFDLPGTPDGGLGTPNSSVYANGFDILRWLPQQCEVILTSDRNPEIDAVVASHMDRARTQDQMAYSRRQLITNEST